ncbi:MAG: sulfite exporter TauE/SafE family protein [Anaerolineales bacterium]
MDLSTLTTIIISIAVFIAALLFAVAGHTGASAYLAIFGLLGMLPSEIKPTVLALNVVVGIVAVYKFTRAGHFSWRLIWPFILTSIPFSFLGGLISLPTPIYRILVGVVLVYAALRMLFDVPGKNENQPDFPPVWLSLSLGAGIGFTGGLIGIGGGILLSPILLLTNWAGPQLTAGTIAIFVLVNSISGLLGHWSASMFLPRQLPLWAGVALVGGWIGAEIGSRKLSANTIRRMLGLILLISGLRMFFL